LGRASIFLRAIVRAANTGASGFVDPAGRIRRDAVDAPRGEPRRAPLDARADRVPERVGDAPAWLAAALVLAMGSCPRRVRAIFSGALGLIHLAAL